MTSPLSTRFADLDPKAHSESLITMGRARFSVLFDRMIRCEWHEHSAFEDRATLSAVSRRVPRAPFRVQRADGRLVIETDKLRLEYVDDGKPFHADNLSARFRLARRDVTWRYGQVDPENLGGTIRTLDGAKGNEGGEWDAATKSWRFKKLDLGRGLVSKSGWAVVDDSSQVVLDARKDSKRPWVTARPAGERRDIYLLAYGHDYTSALRDAAQVFGRQPLPPRFAFGYWYSRYYAYTDREVEAVVEQCDSAGVPLDVMVIDMDWHLPGWTGYTWDRRFFPDPAEHLGYLHSRGVHTTLNLHPADGVGRHEQQFSAMCKALGVDPKKTERVPFAITDPKYMDAYFRLLHHPNEDIGVDFWWMDWQQGNTADIPGLETLPWLNQLHWDDQAVRRPRQRPLCFSRYGGIGAGRYPVGFSGDTHSTWSSLEFQPYFTATASNVLYGYWSHDLGGHMPGKVEPELYTRWVQFGALSPVMRTHTTKAAECERRFWLFPHPFNEVLVQAVRRRYELVPYVYTECRNALETGVSLVRPMYYAHPEEPDAYAAHSQYYFGSRMIAAPIVTPRDETQTAGVRVWLPAGRWIDTATLDVIDGDRSHDRRYLLDEVPTFVAPGTIIGGQFGAMRLDAGSILNLLVECWPGDDGEYELYEDDGVSQDFLAGKHATIPLSVEETGQGRKIRIGPAKGKFKGFDTRRALELRVHLCPPAAKVEVGKRAIPWSFRSRPNSFGYDGMRTTLVVRLDTVDLKREVCITIRDEKSIAPRNLYGVAGLFSGLWRVAEQVNLMSAWQPFHDEERLAVDLAQTGNRITRAPKTTAREIARLKKELPRLPEVLRDYAEVWPKSGLSDAALRRRALLDARMLLLAIMKRSGIE